MKNRVFLRIKAVISLDLSAIIADNNTMSNEYEKIEKAIRLLDGRLELNKSGRFSIVVCGGNGRKIVSIGDIELTVIRGLRPPCNQRTIGP